MGKHWTAEKEQGSYLTLRLLKWVALSLGRPTILVLLIPIVSYYVLFSKLPRKASATYLTKVLNRKPSWLEVWHHFYTFAIVSIDRIYFLTDKTKHLSVSIFGEEIFKDFVQKKQGCLLVVSHVGSFDAMRVRGVKKLNLPIRILMDKQHSSRAVELLEVLAPELAQGVLDSRAYGPELSLKLDQCIKQGELVGIMADRANIGEKVIRTQLWGEAASFPVSPWVLAMVLRVPVILCFGIYRGKGRYDLNFELVESLLDVPRKQRQEKLEQAITHYAQRIEYYTRQEPYNWFNFYEFWSDDTDTNH